MKSLEERRTYQRENMRKWRLKHPTSRRPPPVCEACGRDLDAKQWAYLAGIFDGEGSVHLAPSHNKQGRTKTYNLCVTVVCGVHREAIAAIQSMTGPHGSNRPHGTPLQPINGKGSRRAAWRLRLYGRHAEWFLRGVQPYLLMRAPQTELALEFMAEKGWRGDRGGPQRHEYEASAKAALTVMNQRGVQCALS